MQAVIRLDDDGNPYLVVTYLDTEGQDSNAQEDAERLFFRKLNQNGGSLHLVPGRDKLMKMIVVTGQNKRKTSVTETNILGSPEPREKTDSVDPISLSQAYSVLGPTEFPKDPIEQELEQVDNAQTSPNQLLNAP